MVGHTIINIVTSISPQGSGGRLLNLLVLAMVRIYSAFMMTESKIS